MTDFTAIYIRVSTDEQAKDGISLAMQEDLCNKYIELHGLPKDTIMYRDEGKSAASMDRPALDKLRSDMTAGMITDLVVFKLDRLTRRVGDLCTLLGECERYDVSMHGVRDKLDTGTASGRLVLHIMGAVAEWERDTIADRTSSGMKHIQAQGFHVGNPPFGWERISHDGPGSLLVPGSDYPYIADSRKAHDEGMSLAGIANIVKGRRWAATGKRIISAPLVEEMEPVKDSSGVTIGYKYPVA
jgi:DNA invertase Pin-like site-specific DNA recombinase